MGVTLALLLAGLGQFSATVDLVEVYASVTDPTGQIVGDLEAGDFIVRENGVEQRIETFARGEFPLTVVLALDRSFSMSGAPLRLAREAARTFLEQLRDTDQALVVAVGSQVEPLGELSTDRRAQYAALDGLVPWGTTSLHDAIIAVVNRAGQGTGRRAVIVLSDGHDRYSSASAEDVLTRVRESDVLVYGISLGKAPSPLFGQLATLSGGRAFHVTAPAMLAGVFGAVARELRTQYLLGYTPPPGPAGWRTIDVQVRRAEVRVRARTGYRAR
jgi:Ca-activated chloride channel family protein